MKICIFGLASALPAKRRTWLLMSCAALLLPGATSSRAAERQVVHRNLPAEATALPAVDRLPGTQRMTLAISLPLRNKEALTNLLEQLYDPASPQYHHFLTPAQFAEWFGPAEADYEALKAFAAAHNLTVTAMHPNRAVLDVSGTVADLEPALHVTMRVYKHPTEGRTFYAPDAEPSLDVNVPLMGISGLDNYKLPVPKYHRIPMDKVIQATPKAGSGPIGTYMGYDFRDAYLPGVTLTGAGQVVALFELDGYFPNDPVQYENLAGLPDVPLQNVLLNGFNGAPGFANGEVSLDIEMAIAMAPGLSEVIVYEGFIPLDIVNRMATDDSAKQISCSWSWFPFDPATDQAFQQMGAQGQSFFNASGDSCAMLPPISPPSDDPYITQVGGTTLTTSGPGGAWVSEAVWNFGGGFGSSGGTSGNVPIPSYQQGIDMSTNGGSTALRNFPDVALTADNIFIIADDGTPEDVGGTSAAAPLWAGFTALVNQQALQGGQETVGFLNPAIYAIGKGTGYDANFHDITVGNNTNYISTNLYYAYPGYDLCTGWGTPMGSNLLNTLVPPVFTPVFELVTNILFGGNGNGIIDEDECNDLNLVLVNGGAANATGVQAKLFTSTPGVAIAQANSAYPDMPVGSTATNVTPFKISTSSAFNCGIPVHFTLLVKCDQTTLVIQFRMQSGVPGTPLRFDSVTAIPIPTGGTTNSSVLVSNISFALNKVTVSLFLSDFDDQSMVLQLISPDGTTNLLSANNGFNGQDYGIACSPDAQRAIFDDAAPVPVSASAAPFVGTFQPQSPLSIFNGKAGTNVNGLWQLQVQDSFGVGGAVIECWSLFITPTICVDGGGECPGADLAIGMTAQPAPITEGNNLTYFISVTNLGPSSASNVLVSQLLPSTVSFVSGSSSQGSVSPSGGLVTANVGLLRPNHSATITVIVNTEQAGVISSTATVSSEQPDFNLANNTATAVTVVNPPSADIVVNIAGAPSSTVVGGPLTYTVTIANNGPNTATLVTVSNVLPASMSILSATASQGSVIVSNNVVVCNLGTLNNGSQATAVINVTPTAQGTFVATASASAQQPDPVPSNNNSSTTTIVGPAADLGIGIVGYPNPVVVGSNLTYSISVTNFGPSVASGVAMIATLPTGVALVSESSSQGTISSSSNLVTANLNSLNLGAVVTITIVVTPAGSGVLTTTATVSGGVSDPNLANNTATSVVTVSAPFVSIVPAGARLTAESGPVDGAVDPGETVTVQLSLENIGNVPNTNLVVTLLSTNGVSPANPAKQTYGILPPIGVPGASPTARLFTFTAGTTGASVTAVLSLQDIDSAHGITNSLGTASYTFFFPTVTGFANTNLINIPDHGIATPYPSVINVSGLTGLVSKVTATLDGFAHTYPHDVSALLVGPLGETTLLLSHAGTEPVANLTLTFDDAGSNGPVLATGYLTSGDWQPTAYTPPPLLMSNPAPAGPYSSLLASFGGLSPNGAWSLYVLDDSPGDQGGISNGWSLAITTLTPVNQVADLGISGVSSPNPCLAGGSLTNIFTVTNGGPNTATFVGFTNTLPAGVSLVSATSSQGALSMNGGAVYGNLGTLAAGATATVMEVMVPGPGAAGTVTNVASVTNSTTVIDLDQANNTASIVSSIILPVADVGLSLVESTNTVLVGSNLSYTITVTNSGPQNALNVVVSDPVPAALAAVATNASQGTISSAGNVITWNVGTLLPGGPAATVTVNAVSFSAGVVTNTVSATTASSDPNLANNSASATVTVLNPAPNIVAAGARIVSKSVGVNDGAIDPGDVVTVSLSLQNVGSANTTNLTAVLLAANGLVPSGTQSNTYGALLYGGAAANKPFTFTANGTNGGAVTAMLQLRDGANTNLAPVSFTFYFPATFTYSNTGAIQIPEYGEGVPYPAAINNVLITNASGGAGTVSKATATLYGFGHSFPHDVNALLTSPGSSNVLLMAHSGAGYYVSGVTLTFDDAASNSLPSSAPITSGTYKPTSYQPTNLPVPAPQAVPAGAYGGTLAAFDGSNPNGAWSLYVFDDKPGDAGIIADGWSLSLTVKYLVNPVADLAIGLTSLPTNIFVGGTLLTNTVTVTNLGPAQATGVVVTDVLPRGFSYWSSAPSTGTVAVAAGTLTWSIPTLAVGSPATASILIAPTQQGVFTNVVSVTANESDINTANNTNQAVTYVVSPIAASLNGVISGGHLHLTVSAQPNFSYLIEASTNLGSGAGWVPISTNVASGGGTISVVDTNAFKYRFYRVVRVIP